MYAVNFWSRVLYKCTRWSRQTTFPYLKSGWYAAKFVIARFHEPAASPIRKTCTNCLPENDAITNRALVSWTKALASAPWEGHTETILFSNAAKWEIL